MRRREFITLLGGAVVAWPIAARAQQREQMKRIGILLPATADDAVFQARLAAFYQGLALLGWSIGHNVRIDTRWATTNAAEIRRHAVELVALSRPTSSFRVATRLCRHCYRRPARCRSCPRSPTIRSPPATSTAWRSRAATPPVSCFSNTV